MINPTLRAASLLLALAFVAGPSSAYAADAVPGPELENIPGPQIDLAGSPPAATWPALRYEHPLRLLAILSKLESAAPYQRIARRLHASLEVRYLQAGDDRYHVNDKWIEPSDNPTLPELIAQSKQAVIESTAQINGKIPYDVIFCRQGLADQPLQAALLRFMKAGGIVAASGNFYPAAPAPLAAVWPAKPAPNESWLVNGAQRSAAAPELAGVPLEYLSGWDYMPIAEPADGAVALAKGEAGAMFSRKVGDGWLFYVPSGPISRRWQAIELYSRQFDHDDIWLRAWDQVLYSLAHKTDDEAFPAYVDLQPGPAQAPPSQDYVLPAKIVSRRYPAGLVADIHVTTPQGKVIYRQEKKVDLAAGHEESFEVRIPIPPEWGAGKYPVYLTLSDPARKTQLHQAMELVPVAGQLDLAVLSEKPGYRLGEEAHLVLTASSKLPWNGTLRLGIYDFRGRLLGVQEKPTQLGPQKQQIPFAWRLVDHGVSVDSYWAEIEAVAGDKSFGRAEVRFAKYEPWSMRNEYQWSTWSGIGCAAPSVVPMGMRLMAHAGMNALGYPGRSEIYYAAERWGWRYYNEGIGTNTFAPVIEYENDAEIEAALTKEAEPSAKNPDLVSGAFVLGSVGEEAGFKNGWGTRYYWDTPVAPEKACKAFQWFLREKYPDLKSLNGAWKTQYQSWDEIKLTKEFSARDAVKLEADGWAHPKNSPLGGSATGVTLAPYLDSAAFYDWYYDRIITVARRILHEKINPVTLTMSSAPTIGSANYDVRETGPSAWNESQSYSVMDGPEPGFGLIWGHFDWSVMTDNMFWGFLLERSGHNNYWVDVPLMFNNDLSHTRASFAMRQWTSRLAGHERIILDSRPHRSEVGVLEPSGLGVSLTPRNMLTSLQVALNQGGFGLADNQCLAPGDPNRLDRCKIVFAVGRQAMTQQEADRLNAYVEAGGTLVFTPGLADQNTVGAPVPVVPGFGLAEKWDFHIARPLPAIPQYHPSDAVTCKLDGIADSLRGLKLSSEKIYRERPDVKGWKLLASYDDDGGGPAILTRQLGKGRLVYLNAMYQSHWYIQNVTPTGVERQGFYRLVEWLCTQAGAARTLRIDGDLAQTLHMAVKQFTDPTGKIQYAIVRTNGEVPWTSGLLNWLGPQTACYDVLGGDGKGPTPRLEAKIPLNLEPGAGKLLAFVPAALGSVHVTAQTQKLTAGEPLQLLVEISDDAGRPVPGSFPLTLDVTGPQGNLPGLKRSFSAESGAHVTVASALNDPAGDWQITLTDGISGLHGTTHVSVSASNATARAAGFVPWGQPSEILEPAVLSQTQFLDRLTRLAALYQKDHSAQGWMTKQYLGYYYDYFPNTRHELLRPLLDVDWPAFAPAMREAITGGQTFILTGEDLGVHPGSGLTVYPHHDAGQIAAIVKALEGATWSVISPDGDTIAATLGKGRLILSRESIDAAGNTNPELARWQQRWLAETAKNDPRPIAAPLDQRKILAWWRGEEPIAAAPRTISWFSGNEREIKLSMDPTKPLGETFKLLLPPTGDIQSLTLTVKANGADPIHFDVGCGNLPGGDLTVRPGPGPDANPTPAAWAAAASGYLKWSAANHAGPNRNGSGWRVVPVRVTSSGKSEIVLSDLKLIIE